MHERNSGKRFLKEPKPSGGFWTYRYVVGALDGLSKSMFINQFFSRPAIYLERRSVRQPNDKLRRLVRQFHRGTPAEKRRAAAQLKRFGIKGSFAGKKMLGKPAVHPYVFDRMR